MVKVDEVLGTLRWAIAGERDGYRFYLEAAERSADSMGKSTFLDLARAEEDHLRLLLVEYESVSSGQGWVDPEEAMAREVEVDITMPLFPGDEGVLEEGESPFGETWAAYEIDGISGDLAALEFGMEMERRFYQAYKKASTEARDMAGRQAYEFLMREENGHFKLIQDAHSYLSDNKHWWDDEELPFFEG